MPSSPPRSIPRGLTVTEICKFIPQSWKQPPPRPITDGSVPDALFKSLGHFVISHGHLCEAFRTFSLLLRHKRMLSKEIRPDAFTYPSVLKACVDFASGRAVHGSLYVCNALISMYNRFGRVEIARRLFDRMSERDAVSWNAVINCYASQGKWEEALRLIHRMELSGVEMSVVTWNTVAKGYLQRGDYAWALNIVAKMRNYNVSLDSVAMVNGLKACSQALQLGKQFHCLAICSCCARIDNVENSLITMYSRCGDLRSAFIVFQQIEANSLSAWNSIIFRLCTQ
ncbi:unnamed protein product [Microthlaspi erraticum]|uniref:Pentacotripeptide-repeat region of PRORP domain-containing protein n=1 Tax=Microthlaspi erraticum TaxID=1685480 RepID=A0A6D2L542_9BRAS|nr:unnamed protein product [Microthlaspi erraticum]